MSRLLVVFEETENIRVAEKIDRYVRDMLEQDSPVVRVQIKPETDPLEIAVNPVEPKDKRTFESYKDGVTKIQSSLLPQYGYRAIECFAYQFTEVMMDAWLKHGITDFQCSVDKQERAIEILLFKGFDQKGLEYISSDEKGWWTEGNFTRREWVKPEGTEPMTSTGKTKGG